MPFAEPPQISCGGLEMGKKFEGAVGLFLQIC